jgi:hypothetical protein
MSQNLNSVSPFDGTNYGYWKAHMRFFLKSIDVWKFVETSWIKPEETDKITENNLLTSNLNQVCVCVQKNILKAEFK